jgi:hypothetical protein
LRNLAFTAPYSDDGRAPDLAAVVAHFDQTVELGLSAAERADLVTYLEAVGDAERPFERKDLAFDMAEIAVFTGLLDQTLADRDIELTRLIVDTVNAELREVAEHWYRPEDRDVRGAIVAWAVQLRRVDGHARDGNWPAAGTALASYRSAVEADLPIVAAAEPRSTYHPAVLADYLQELRRVAAMASKVSAELD